MSEPFEDEGPSRAMRQASRPALIERFAIEGLYGYRSIALDSEHAATILIARNGSGKTTLLGALDAFLRMQLTRLRDLKFDYIVCRMREAEADLIITHDDVTNFCKVPDDNEFTRTAIRAGVEPQELLYYLVTEYSSQGRLEQTSSEGKIPTALRQSFRYDYSEMTNVLDRLRDHLYHRIDNIRRAWEFIRPILSQYEIVYLPTYRRVELSILEDGQSRASRRQRKPRIAVAAGSLFTGDIQFGLGDISDRLEELSDQIGYAANRGYAEISANIINTLIDDSISEGLIKDHEIPPKEELSLFFSRLKRTGRRINPYSATTPPNLDKLYNAGNIPESLSPFLRYFLAQLGKVISATKEVEAPVDEFKDRCNKYLMMEEPSTVLKDDENEGHLSHLRDGKRLKISRENLRVHVESLPEGRRVSLDALSSGEKQMISLFARMFLYPKRKIVLIDEPELSLSIDWQAQVLVDVLDAPLCEQVVAITHSPFIFDNELDRFARPLRLSRTILEKDIETGAPADEDSDDVDAEF